MYKNKSIEGVKRVVVFNKETDDTLTLFLHPDGARNSDMVPLAAKLDRVRRAANHVERIATRLSSGTISAESYLSMQADLDAEKEAEVKKAGSDAEKIKQIEATYRNQSAYLINARDGQPVTPEEDERLTAEQEQWVKAASVKPFAVPYLHSVILSWDYYEDEAAKENGDAPLPVTLDNLNEISESRIKAIFEDVLEFYGEQREAEKKSTDKSESPSVTVKESVEPSLNGFRSLELPDLMESDPVRLPDGENESLHAHSQN